jgi:peptide/nickel transport system substrate-binding protein
MMKSLTIGVAAAALLAASAGYASAAYMAEHRGGTLKVMAHSAGGTIDPHINYTLQYWQVYQEVYDGLLKFKRVDGPDGFNVVPDLAEAIPAPENGGKTYVFTLRKGIKFSDGREVGVKDVVASFQRIFKISSPTSGTFYAGIVGADACLKDAKTCTLDGGVVGDEAKGTVTINLSAPDAEFFQKLALPHAVVLPADAPAQDVGSNPVIGTGPYVIKDYDPNKQMTLVRNPTFKSWSEDAVPDGYPDQIDYGFSLTDEAQTTAVENGEIDWMFDQVPTDRLAEVGTKFKDTVHVTPLTAYWYAPLNVNIAPFNNEKARQALNYAIDRNQMVKLFGGQVLAQPSCQILPAGFPGHEDYCPYTAGGGPKYNGPDLEKAKKLMADSGQKGQKVTIITEDTDASKSLGTYLQSVMNDLGFDTSTKAISTNLQFTYIQNTKNNVQMSISQWYQDYPAASDFLYILLGCESFHKDSDNSINIAGFCDKDINDKMHKALELGVTDQAAANKMWAEIDRAMVDKSPIVAFFNPKHIDFTSKRLGNFKFNSQFYFMLGQAWVK